MALVNQLPVHIIFCTFTYFLTCCFAEEILGCGGFVKSDLDINLSQVEVKLYTKQGSLKDHTDCAPNNGYYFLPFYDKGEYVLKIEPPSGWSFQPQEVALNIDGVTDPCSQGKDINFVLLGFAVKGKVLSSGSDSGPKNVRVLLYREAGEAGEPKLAAETATNVGGGFLFTPVLPGRYTVRVEHPRWRLARGSASVLVAGGNAVVPDGALAVGGYDVSGEVTSDGEPIRGVSFVLFQKDDGKPPPVIEGCSKTPLSGFEGTSSLCHVVSDEAGQFSFPSVPPGRYSAVPHYEGAHSLQFDVQPKQTEFTVKHDSVRIATPFQVTGFSVSGRVLTSAGGSGVDAAAVYLDGKVATHTRPDGTYHLESLKAGSYRIQVQAKDMKFDETVVKISPNTPVLPPLYPSAFRVCGRVLPYHYQRGGAEQGARRVALTREGSAAEAPAVVEARAGTGEFCHTMQPGKYEARVEVTEADRSRGLQFFPAGLVINVKDRPILTGIEFSQLKAKLSGQIVCDAPACPDITVSLLLIVSESERFAAGSAVAVDGKYSLDQLLPGTYQVAVDKGDWCWAEASHVVTIDSIQATAPTFRQTGYAVTIISSHDIQVSYEALALPPPPEGKDAPPAPPPVSGRQPVPRGTSQFCVKQPGEYRLTPHGCHGYAHHSYVWSSRAADVPVMLTAVSHTLGGRVVSPDLATDVVVNVRLAADNTIKTRLGPLRGEPQGGRHVYSFSLLLAEGESVVFEPTAGLLLFEPPRVAAVGGGDCAGEAGAVQFAAAMGKIVRGRMAPASAGVRVTVADERGATVAQTETDGEGAFRVGPLPGHVEYRVSAEKEGYVISGPDANGNFNVHKLAQIDVTVTDTADSKPLQGVLLSLSGGDSFRRNSQTNALGAMTFTSLSPGEYYLRPMMKEYKFEPSSRMITVKEGATLDVKLAGHRVAFSAYGSVTSLNGEPEDGVAVEAVGRGPACPQQEEATTEANGQFRIRGLQPGCEYVVRVKHGNDVNQHVQKGSAAGVTVKVSGDIRDVKLLALQRLAHMDLTTTVSAPTLEHLRSLKVKLCRDDVPDSPVHVLRLSEPSGTRPTVAPSLRPTALLLFPTIPLDNRSYFLQLESTLPKAADAFLGDHVVHFKANTSFKHVSLVFTPEQKASDQDLGQSSYLALVVLALLVALFLYRDKVGPAVVALRNGLSGGAGAAVAPAPAKRGNGGSGDMVEREAEAIVVEAVAGGVSKRKVKSRKT